MLVTLTLAIGQRTSWPFAIAAGMIIELSLVALVLRFAPAVGVDLVGGAAIMFAVLGCGALAVLAASRPDRFIGRRELRVVTPLLVTPVLLVVIVAVFCASTGTFEWAMHNDAVWNLVTTRMLIADGGLDAVAHPNASPLTPGLLAIAAAVGRGTVAPADLLSHDIGRFATFWLICVAASALLAALIGARSVHGGSRVARVGAAAAVASIPFAWFTFGFASQFGFYNASLTLLLLLAMWLAWLETRVSPVAGAGVLSLASVALLATWAPVAAIPFALGAFALVSRMPFSTHGGRRARGAWWLALALAPVPLYVVAVTLPDLRRDGAALAVDGGILPLLPVHVAVITAVAVSLSVLTALHLHQRHQLAGVVVVVLVSIVVGVYLVAQRAGAQSWWGYYPAKFAWLIASLLLVIISATLLSELAVLRHRRLAATGVIALSILVPGVLMAQVPPSNDRLASLITPVAIITQRGVAAGHPVAERLFELAEPGVRTMAISYRSPADDRFLNSWLLQLESTSAEDPIRTYSYGLDPRDEEQACAAIRTWNAPVRVVTSDPTLSGRLPEECAGAQITIELLSP
ncbi:hypothetical protein [Microbacterium paulum]